jgi:site-specific DNA-methyltransferase (adenine-specific)
VSAADGADRAGGTERSGSSARGDRSTEDTTGAPGDRSAEGDAAAPGDRPARRRGPTATARFGSGRRESHDASAFYDRFVSPELSADDTVERNDPAVVDTIHPGDISALQNLKPGSVALVVTSPPYFAGKAYEESLGENGVPADYFEYLAMLERVFAECARVLEPGGRIAVNVANLGRRPYRSLAGDVTQILQDLGLLLRGEVVWWKGRAAGGSCAWGTFQRPTNPVLRDVTERVVIASKGRFDRALTPAQREQRGLPHRVSISRDEFLEATTDLWEMAPESATRVGHPAPFPVDLPERLIHLYTYVDDLVLDPFMGSGSTAVAALRTGRRYVGYDTDPAYVARAEERLAAERERLVEHAEQLSLLRVDIPGASTRRPTPADDAADGEAEGDFQSRAVKEGRQAKEIAAALLADCGFTVTAEDVKFPCGVEVNLVAADRNGDDWAFDVSGAFTSNRAGLKRTDTLWKALGKASVLHLDPTFELPLVLLTTDAPTRGSAGAKALAMASGVDADGAIKPVAAVVEMFDPDDRAALAGYAEGGRAALTGGPAAR